MPSYSPANLYRSRAALLRAIAQNPSLRAVLLNNRQDWIMGGKYTGHHEFMETVLAESDTVEHEFKQTLPIPEGTSSQLEIEITHQHLGEIIHLVDVLYNNHVQLQGMTAEQQAAVLEQAAARAEQEAKKEKLAAPNEEARKLQVEALSPKQPKDNVDVVAYADIVYGDSKPQAEPTPKEEPVSEDGIAIYSQNKASSQQRRTYSQANTSSQQRNTPQNTSDTRFGGDSGREFDSKNNYYADLGLSPGASKKEVNTAYKKQALKNHPDKQHGKSDTERATAEAKFKKASEAYQVLGDNKTRGQYLDKRSDLAPKPASRPENRSSSPGQTPTPTRG